MLETRNIFIDTQTFVANNFFVGENIHRLAVFGQMGIVKLFLTEITINEIQSNIKEELQNAQAVINEFKKNINQKGRILKNIDEFQEYLKVPKLELNVDFEKIKKELDEFIIKGNVEIIPFEFADLTKIVTKYFNQESPFGAGKKKYEFPDAIVLSAIEVWCKKEGCKIYIISNDVDMKTYESDIIISLPTLRDILNKINRQYQTDRLEWIQSIFDRSECNIIEEINERFVDRIKDEFWFDIKITKVNVTNVRLHEASIVQDNEDGGETVFQLDVDIEFYAEIEYNNFSLSSYDREDYSWSMPERTHTRLKMETTQTAEISIEAIYDDKLIDDIDDYSIRCNYCSIPDSEEITDQLEGFRFQL